MVTLNIKNYGSHPEGSRSLLPTVPGKPELSRFESGFWAASINKYSSSMERSQGGIL